MQKTEARFYRKPICPKVGAFPYFPPHGEYSESNTVQVMGGDAPIEHRIVRLVENRYGIRISEVDNIVSNNRRSVWKVEADDRLYALKHARILSDFSLRINHYLGHKGISSRVVRTSDGALWFDEDGIRYCLTRWIDGRMTSNPIAYIRAVASFHRTARLPDFPEAVYGPSSTEQWLRIYRKKIKKLHDWSRITDHRRMKKAFVQALDVAERMANDLRLMELESYVAYSLRSHTVVHWDLHRGNIIYRGGKPYILDLDNAEISMQVCDFHQVLSDLMEAMNVSSGDIRGLLKEYFAVYTRAADYRRIYLTVCRFPHYFWTIAERFAVYGGAEDTVAEKLLHIAAMERRKQKLILGE